jgi:dihydrofolate synthase/folylpolyglutamate synthase
MSFLDRLESLEVLGIKFGLDNIRTLLGALGNPERDFSSILIAGTNGKGSVASMLEAILRKNSYRTGIYTSPHLVNIRERISVNGTPISEEEFESVLSRVLSAADAHLTSPPTYFETLTAAAMLHFKEASIDSGVIEVGMGGRYDATNAIHQELSIVTSIDFDHESYLGRTLESIAAEKAAISKPGIPMITGVLPPEADAVIQKVVQETGSALYRTNPSNVLEEKLDSGHPVFVYAPWNAVVRVNLRGRHQAGNAEIALLASDLLQLDRNLTLQALSEVEWPGRLQVAPGFDPPLLLDCAHNPMGARSLDQFLDDMDWKKVIVIFTSMRDKDFQKMVSVLAPKIEHAVLTQVKPLHRCATREQLLAMAESLKTPSDFKEDPLEALDLGLELSRKSDLPLVIFGSIYLIGKMYSILDIRTS